MTHDFLAGVATLLKKKNQLVLSALLISACGKTNFSGRSDVARPVEPTPEPVSADSHPDVKSEPEEEELHLVEKGIEWFWQCETAPVSLPSELSSGKTLIEGTGPHKLPKPHGDQLSLHVSGFLCPPITSKRDVVVVVDVSSSTTETDPGAKTNRGAPVKPRECERKRAVKALLTQLGKQATVNVGFVTFSSNVKYASTKLIPATNLGEADYDGDSLCAATGSTNYADALRRASQLLDLGRQEAIKEIYFVTDGEPDSEEESREAAADVRTKATLATIMFGDGDPDHLKNEVASKDDGGNPIHATVTDVKNLASALENLSKSVPVKGSFKYKPRNAQDWREADLWQFVHNGVFDITALALDPREFGSGISFAYTYEDNRGNKMTSSGEIIWE
jgi:uncharacterized protein YegL